MENILLNLNYDWLHNKIIYESPPALYRLAIAKSAANVYSEENDEFSGPNKLFERVQEKIKLLVTPESFKTRIALMIELMNVQLREFIKLLPNECSNEKGWIFLKNKIYWTSQGTIDTKRTAEALASSIDFSLKTRFDIAVTFLLQDQINILSVQLPRDHGSFRKELAGIDDISIAKNHFRIPELEIDVKEYFKAMIKNGYKLASHYYWQRLSEEEKLEFLDPQFIKTFNQPSESHFYMLFLFTHCDIEIKEQLLQNEDNYCTLLKQLLDLQWIHIFDSCLKDSLQFWTADFVVKLLDAVSERMRSTKSHVKKYEEITASLLEHLCQECSMTTLTEDSNETIMDVLHRLAQKEELKIIKDFIDTVNKEWIKEQFSDCKGGLEYLVSASVKCGLLEFVFNCAFPTVEEKITFLNEEKPTIFAITETLFSENELDDVDRVLFLLFLNSEEVNRFKKEFAESFGFDCFLRLAVGDWEFIHKFAHHCYDSEEEIVCFYADFFRKSDFPSLFEFLATIWAIDFSFTKAKDFFRNFTDAIISLIKADNLISQPFSDGVVVDICWRLLFKCYSKCCYHNPELCENNILFNLMDRFLLAFSNNDQKTLADWKAKLFINGKLYVSLLLDFLREIVKMYSENWKRKNDMWIEMSDGFLNWICSLDEKIKMELEKEFWSSKEVINASKQLKMQKKGELNFEIAKKSN